MKFRVIFRACDKVFCTHNVGRPFAKDKKELIQVCFHSLVKNLSSIDYTIDVIGDQLSDEMVTFFQGYRQVIVHNLNLGNAGKSIVAALDKGLGYADDDWVYFCEDDYLHSRNFGLYLAEFIHNKDKYLQLQSRKGNRTKWLAGEVSELPLFIHPSDYPDSYLPRNSYMSLLFLSKYCHWVQRQTTTHTFITQVSSLKKYEGIIRESGVRHDDAFLSRKTYGKNWLRGNKALCLSPIPGLSAHLTDDVMSPYVDWAHRYFKILAEINE